MLKVLIILTTLITLSLANDSFSLKLSKTKAYLNEPIVATFSFSYPSKDKPKYIKFSLKDNQNFLAKKIDEKTTISNNTTTIKYYYLLFPQYAKELTLNSQTIKIARLEPKTSMTIWTKLTTKEQTIKVLPLPKDITISGDLMLNIDTKKREQNIIDLNITLSGLANLEDLKPFKLNLKNATIYQTKPTIKYKILNNQPFSTYTQKITILTNSNLTIPPLSLKYFNTNTKMPETLQTKPINITLNKSKFTKNELIALIIGIIVGILIAILLKFIRQKSLLKKLPLHQKIKLCQTQKCLYKTLLPYINRYDLEEIIKKLEANIFQKQNKKIDKKEIIRKIES